MKRASYFLIILAGCLWGIMGLFVRTLTAWGLSSTDIVWIRAVVTALVLFLYLLLFDRKSLKIKWKDSWCFLGTGILSIVFFNYCYFKAMTLMSLSVAAVLLYTAPVFVMLLSAVLFREKITIVKVVAAVMTFVGCVLITGMLGSSVHLSIFGVLIGLGAGLGYALYSIFGRYALERGYHAATVSFYTFLIAAVGSLPLVNMHEISGMMNRGYSAWAFAIAFGILSTVIPFFSYTVGLSHVENSKASIIASVEPVTATLLGVLLYRETLAWYEWMGILFVFISVVLCASDGKKKDGAESMESNMKRCS